MVKDIHCSRCNQPEVKECLHLGEGTSHWECNFCKTVVDVYDANNMPELPTQSPFRDLKVEVSGNECNISFNLTPVTG